MILADLIGKGNDDIEERLRGMKRDRLVKIIQQLATIEPHFSPDQVAAARGLSVEKILQLIRDNWLRAHLPSHNRYRIPRSAVEEWDKKTLVRDGTGESVQTLGFTTPKR